MQMLRNAEHGVHAKLANLDCETDLESILDEFLGSGIKQFSLLWHYRSRKEGLIASSNYHYYQNQLHTFPPPHSDDVGVQHLIAEQNIILEDGSYKIAN